MIQNKYKDVDYISLTDLVKYQNPEDPSDVIKNWMSNRNSFDYYGLWEQINNENFNSVEFHVIKTEEADVLNVALFVYNIKNRGGFVTSEIIKFKSTKKDEAIMMIGSGEHSTFIKVKKGKKVMLNDGTFVEAGLTPEEPKTRLDDKCYIVNQSL